jgi:hypothetical protein
LFLATVCSIPSSQGWDRTTVECGSSREKGENDLSRFYDFFEEKLLVFMTHLGEKLFWVQ